MYNGVYTVEQYAYMHDTLVKWLKEKIDGGSLGQKLQSMGISGVAVYGANELGRMVCHDIEDSVMVSAYIDKNASRFQEMVDGKTVLDLDHLGLLPEDSCILVTPEFYFKEIMEDLTERGIAMERILSLSMVV